MPIYIVLKEPGINLIVGGAIGDKDTAFYDALFNNGVIMQKDRDGNNMVIPVWKESNIAFMKTVTEKEMKEIEAKMEKQKKEAEAKGGGTTTLKPTFGFPRGNPSKRRPGGGGITL